MINKQYSLSSIDDEFICSLPISVANKYKLALAPTVPDHVHHHWHIMLILFYRSIYGSPQPPSQLSFLWIIALLKSHPK